MPRTISQQFADRGIKQVAINLKRGQRKQEKSPVNKIRRVESNDQPTLLDGETVEWWDIDGTKMYLLTRRGASYYKVELT